YNLKTISEAQEFVTTTIIQSHRNEYFQLLLELELLKNNCEQKRRWHQKKLSTQHRQSDPVMAETPQISQDFYDYYNVLCVLSPKFTVMLNGVPSPSKYMSTETKNEETRTDWGHLMGREIRKSVGASAFLQDGDENPCWFSPIVNFMENACSSEFRIPTLLPKPVVITPVPPTNCQFYRYFSA
ncbi:hypothetical protein J0S82_004727, partial [Galemys pyrenaicus]